MKANIKHQLDQNDLDEIERINSYTIKEALDRIKANKYD